MPLSISARHSTILVHVQGSKPDAMTIQAAELITSTGKSSYSPKYRARCVLPEPDGPMITEWVLTFNGNPARDPSVASLLMGRAGT